MTIKVPYIVKPPSSAESRADEFIAGAGNGKPEVAETGKATVNMRFDAILLAKIDAAARKQGISRTAWLHVAAAKALD
jgi:hypothetical protein